MNEAMRPEELTQEQLARMVTLMVHQIFVHHGLYFSETIHQFGIEKALSIMDGAWEKICKTQVRRLSKQLGFDLKDNIPQPMLDMSREELLAIIRILGMSWLATDGIWFQEVEKNYTTADAQRCAGGCIAKFCTFEAYSIKRFLELPEQAGLAGLKRALRFRAYHQINVQTIIEESPDSLVFQMNECIVQVTRKEKGLNDYPCKSTGMSEYRAFAQAIDPRITVECIGCPPDEHPQEWYCAWRFTLGR